MSTTVDEVRKQGIARADESVPPFDSKKIAPIVYEQLKRLAHSFLRHERRDHSLQTTALVHEAYLRLADQRKVSWQNRAHFLGIAAQAMRRILVDHARSQRRIKRGGGRKGVALFEEAALIGDTPIDYLALDEAMNKLAEKDEKKCRIVELRFFGGLSVEETADALGVSTATVKRDWRMAKAWLHREMQHGEASR